MKREIHEQVQDRVTRFNIDLITYLPKLETKAEGMFIDILEKVGIKSSVKTDKYSLPFKDEIVIKLHCESYINGMFEYERMGRKVIKELLNNDVHKIRFYVFIETFDSGKGFFGTGIKYSFRYYVHNL